MALFQFGQRSVMATHRLRPSHSFGAHARLSWVGLFACTVTALRLGRRRHECRAPVLLLQDALGETAGENEGVRWLVKQRWFFVVPWSFRGVSPPECSTTGMSCSSSASATDVISPS